MEEKYTHIKKIILLITMIITLGGIAIGFILNSYDITINVNDIIEDI